MLHKNIEIREAHGKGRGLYATTLIKAGEVIWSDVDLLNTELEFTAKELNSLASDVAKHCYWNDGIYVWHPNDPGNYMNHSCEPNVWHSDKGQEMTARRDIQPGEEITYDYATCEIEPWGTIILAECLCGSPKCRHTIRTSDLFLNTDVMSMHMGHLPRYAQEELNEYLRMNA